jgi:hypothetical protein
MTQNFDNRTRAFADVVTIDAWHKAFDGGTKEVDLHADIVFGIGRVGGEVDSPVRFRLSVKRAELVVVIPSTEPLSVNREKVSRDSPEAIGTMTHVFEDTSRKGIGANISASATGSKPKFSAGVTGMIATNSAVNRKLEVTSAVRLFTVTQSKSEDGFYRWTIETQARDALEGRPWDSSEPRLTLIDNRRDRMRGLEPTVRIEVRCRREDLVIEDIELKDEKLWDTVKSSVGFRNKLAAAESYIRSQLVAMGLEVKNIEDKFGHLTIASVTAASLST